jgi:signal transduction histidine kinase
MSLKKRLILILIVCGFMLALLFHFSFNATIVPDLKQQKEVFNDKLKHKFQTSLLAEEKSITTLCRSWTDWDNMRDYIKKPSPEFEKDFLSDSSFLSHRLNVILVLAPDGKILFNKNYRGDVKFITFNRLEIGKDLDKITDTVKKTQRLFHGIINSAYGPLMTAANPVNTSGGILVLGRFMDQVLLEKISLHFTETFQPISFKNKELFAPYLKQMQGKHFYSREDKKKITILYLLKDINGDPSIIFKIETGNKLFRVVKRHTLLYILFSILSMVSLGVLIYILIEKYINKRIIKISTQMKNVQGFKDISVKIARDTKGDEISSLVEEINNMLDKIREEKEDRKKIEQTMLTNEKLVSIGRLASSISHEINNPILVISNCLEAIKNTCIGSSDIHKEAIAVSKKESHRVRNIISNLLDFHRLEKEEFSEVNLNDVLLQSIEVLKWSKKLDSIKIITKKDQDFLIFGSPGKLKQVFINFILNAAEASGGKKGVLWIEIQSSGDKEYCEVHFIDNGPGLSPEIEERLFEPFVSTKQDKGVGLGLYVSYKIIKSHGGEILYNDTYKEGTYFIIKLPLKAKERQE